MRWPSLACTCGKTALNDNAEGPSKSERVKRLRSRLGVCTSPLAPAVHSLLRFAIPCDAAARRGPSRRVSSIFRKSLHPQWAMFIYRCNGSNVVISVIPDNPTISFSSRTRNSLIVAYIATASAQCHCLYTSAHDSNCRQL